MRRTALVFSYCFVVAFGCGSPMDVPVMDDGASSRDAGHPEAARIEGSADTGSERNDADDAAMDAASETGADVISPPDAALDAAKDAEAGCNMLTQGAQIVSVEQRNQMAPSATQGNVVTGLYYLTAVN